MSGSRRHISDRFHTRIDIGCVLGHAVADLESYERACDQARASGRVDDLPNALDPLCGIQVSTDHRKSMVDGLLADLKALRDRTERGDMDALDAFFNTYVFGDKPFKYVRRGTAEVAA